MVAQRLGRECPARYANNRIARMLPLVTLDGQGIFIHQATFREEFVMPIPEEYKSLQTLIESIRKNTFIEGYHATDAECLGIALARYFRGNGLQILKTTYSALEDVNFHTENLKIAEMIVQLEG